MWVKRILILAPLLVVIFLLQSYFWVPTYEEQTKGNPERLQNFITASIGDASILNPVLSSDSASSEIESKVFEGLVGRDKDLSIRGRLAKDWQIYEIAYFYINKEAIVPGLESLKAKEVQSFVQEACRDNYKNTDPELQKSLSNIKDIEILPAQNKTITYSFQGEDKGQQIEIQAPARIKLKLKTIDQDIFKNLAKILGEDYFSSFPAKNYIRSKKELDKDQFKEIANTFLSATEHNPIILFHLRSDVYFHDNYQFDAEDVKFTYEAIMNEKNLSPRVSDFEPIKQVEVIDKFTVKVVYKKLYSPALASWSIGILPEHLLNKEVLAKEAKSLGQDPKKFSLRDSSFNRHPIGCGPFQFVEWKSDQYITLKRFKNYWEGAPNYKKYIFRIIPDLLTQEMEFYAGTLDSYSVQPHQVERLKNDPRFQSFSGTSFGYTYIGYNMRREPFNDIRVRRALSKAIDVNKIIEYVLYGQGERITGPFVKQTEFYNPDIDPVAYDPQGALELLKKAGWEKNSKGWLEKEGKRLQFTLITNSGNDIRKSILAIVQDAWKQIGVDIQTDTLEWSVFIQERVNKLDFDAVILGWVMGIEPDLYQIWHSSQCDPMELNFVGFKNKEADKLILKIRKEYNRKKQAQLCHRLHKIIAREQPYTFLYVGKWTAVLDKRIVIKEVNKQEEVVYKKIKPTKTGDYTFYFNKWIKLPEEPEFAING